MNEKDIAELGLTKVASIPIETIREMMKSSLQNAISEVPNEQIPALMNALFEASEADTAEDAYCVFIRKFEEDLRNYVRSTAAAKGGK